MSEKLEIKKKKMGRPNKYNESTTVLAVKVPISQYNYMKNIVELLLKQFEV